MAGAKDGSFRELLSPFLRRKLTELTERHGAEHPLTAALARQYLRDPLEDRVAPGETSRHFESEVLSDGGGTRLRGVERLYRRTVLIEPTTVCAAHCRWCLRGQYPVATLGDDEIEAAARFMGSADNRDDLDEVLVTGGDPLVSLPRLAATLDAIRRHAPNIRRIRIGTRVPFQDPRRVDASLVGLIRRFGELRFEVGLHVNHPVEFWPESVAAVERLAEAGVRLYNQHPLLKGVNDALDVLVELYDGLRRHGIEAHYLFHAVPMRGMHHHRTSLARALDLAQRLCSSGEMSGRAKPRLAILSDIGKIVLHEGSVLDRDPGQRRVLIRSGYRLEERLRWNPTWMVPDSVRHLDDGTLAVWYLDGADAPAPAVRRLALTG